MSSQGTRRGEFELIADMFSPLSRRAPGAFRLTDDAAFIDVTAGCQLVATTDTVIAGVHFRMDDPPEMIARKALRVNLSDLAAKGARPIGFLQALALNPSIDDAYLERYAAGLAADVDGFDIALLGGDTTSGPGPLAITITAFGEVEQGRALLRSGGRRGDVICVSGTIGDGALGLACLEAKVDLPPNLVEEAVARYRLPAPRLSAGAALAGLATACLDISDGLVADIAHICAASGLAATIERESIPLSPAGRAAIAQDQGWWDAILGGGDDYELAFAIPPDGVARLAALSADLGIAFTPIGVLTGMETGAGVTVRAGGQAVHIARSGYRHR